MFDAKIEKLLSAFYSKNVVVITGAGISTLSGIPDFRGKNGLYKKNIDAEEILSIHYFEKYPLEFYEFYRNNMVVFNIEPNVIHNVLTSLEKSGHVNCIITQNIDNLHQKSGSKNVIDLHGNGEEYYCISCKTKYDTSYYLEKGYICEKCGSIVRPNIVLYGEMVEQYKKWKSGSEIQKADVLIVLGSSLLVSTVSNLVSNFIHINRLKNNNDSLYIINNSETPFDYFSNKYEYDLANVFKKVKTYKNTKNL